MSKIGQKRHFQEIGMRHEVLSNTILLRGVIFISVSNTFIGPKTNEKKVSSALQKMLHLKLYYKIAMGF